MKLENNTILITGGTSGIGLALAERLAKNNTIIILSRSQNKLNMIHTTHPSFDTFLADVSNPQTLTELPQWIQQHHPHLNMVINSAGIMSAYDLFDTAISPSTLVSDIQTNLIGTVIIDKLLLRQLAKQSESMIVNISSGLRYISSAAHPTYSASKAGVHMFTDALREQLHYTQRDHIHVVELVPPMVAETNLEKHASTDATGNMALSTLVNIAIKGMSKNTRQINAGGAKLLKLLSIIAPNHFERTYTKSSMSDYFPQGLQ